MAGRDRERDRQVRSLYQGKGSSRFIIKRTLSRGMFRNDLKSTDFVSFDKLGRKPCSLKKGVSPRAMQLSYFI